MTAVEMRAVWEGIDSKCVDAGFPSGEVAANALLGVAAYALLEPPTAKEREVFHGGREAEIARQIRRLVSPGPFDSGAAFYGHESCVLFLEWCSEALRIAEYFEAEARKSDTWEPAAQQKKGRTGVRFRFMRLIGEELLRLFGDASPSWIEVITNAAFPELPADHKTAGEVSRALKARNLPL